LQVLEALPKDFDKQTDPLAEGAKDMPISVRLRPARPSFSFTDSQLGVDLRVSIWLPRGFKMPADDRYDAASLAFDRFVVLHRDLLENHGCYPTVKRSDEISVRLFNKQEMLVSYMTNSSINRMNAQRLVRTTIGHPVAELIARALDPNFFALGCMREGADINTPDDDEWRAICAQLLEDPPSGENDLRWLREVPVGSDRKVKLIAEQRLRRA